jgi:hypothetical protein
VRTTESLRVTIVKHFIYQDWQARQIFYSFQIYQLLIFGETEEVSVEDHIHIWQLFERERRISLQLLCSKVKRREYESYFDHIAESSSKDCMLNFDKIDGKLELSASNKD